MHCLEKPGRCRVLFMMQRLITDLRRWIAGCGLIFLLLSAGPLAAEPPAAAVAAFNTYVGALESRLAQQHRSQSAFLAPVDAQGEARLCRGELIVEKLTPLNRADLPGAMLVHWRGTAFVPGATATDFERLMKDFNAYPQHYAPQVLTAKVLSQHGDHLQAMMRVRQRHILTVVMDTSYDITYARLDARNSSQEHGFLWRLNTYWSYEERGGGLYMQIESVSLTRSIPHGLSWAVGPFVESVPRESLEFTLRSTYNALRR